MTMKFLAWLFGIIFLLVTPIVAVFFNFHLIFFSPESTKSVLVATDFYNQAKSVIKKASFREGMSKEEQSVANITTATLNGYDFQPKVETTIDSFYSALGSKSDKFSIIIDLTDLKSLLLKNAKTESKNQSITLSDIQIPDQWQVDLGQYGGMLKIVRFFYQYYSAIMIGYIVLAMLFLLFCILSGVRYLKLFFAIVLISSILIFAQEFFWLLFNPAKLFSAIFEQGKTGLEVVIGSIYDYFKKMVYPLLLWESLPTFFGSIVGLIVVGTISRNKASNVPLNSGKNS